jgi:long-chain acyl-CoA synthetase
LELTVDTHRVDIDPWCGSWRTHFSSKPSFSAIAVPTSSHLSYSAKRHDPGGLSGEETERLLIQRMAEVTRDLPRHAQIRRIWPTPVPWTVENGLLTVTLKPRREELVRRFTAEIERLYHSPRRK